MNRDIENGFTFWLY